MLKGEIGADFDRSFGEFRTFEAGRVVLRDIRSRGHIL